MAIKDYNTDPDLNVTISGINIAEGCPPSGINNAIRQLMADVKTEQDEAEAQAKAQAAKDAEQDTKINKSITSFEQEGLEFVITYNDGTVKRLRAPSGSSVGDKWWGIDPASKPANVQLYAGQLLSRSAYEAHSAFVLGGNRTVLSEAEWQARVAADGICPFYSSGDGSTTYRMPLIKGVHPQFVEALAEAGQYIKAGLPNITGAATAGEFTGWADPTTSPNQFDSRGAMQWKEAGDAGLSAFEGNTGASSKSAAICIDASLSSAVYRNDCDTVQPPSVTCILGEYVVGSVAVIGEADAESLLAGQTLLDGKVGALESGVGRASAYITETWSSGTSWSRKWSDGWIEQGGVTPSIGEDKSTTITLPCVFSTTTYTVVAAQIAGTTGEYTNGFCVLTKTVSNFVFKHANYTATYNWTACGY